MRRKRHAATLRRHRKHRVFTLSLLHYRSHIFSQRYRPASFIGALHRCNMHRQTEQRAKESIPTFVSLHLETVITYHYIIVFVLIFHVYLVP